MYHGISTAPSTEVFGLKLGATSADDAAAWLAARGLTCPGVPAPRRATVRYACEAGLDAALPDRVGRGKLATLLLSRTESGPVHYLSVVRRYSVPEAAADEFAATRKSLGERYGTPTRERPVDPKKLAGPMARFSTEWRFADLDVSLSLFKGGSGTLSLTEVYAVPGVEAGVGARPGSEGHGSGGERPKGWNPHVEAAPKP